MEVLYAGLAQPIPSPNQGEPGVEFAISASVSAQTHVQTGTVVFMAQIEKLQSSIRSMKAEF
jgi:hypothetical protein